MTRRGFYVIGSLAVLPLARAAVETASGYPWYRIF